MSETTYAASWQPATPEIEEALNNILALARCDQSYTGNKRSKISLNDRRNLLIDARIRLIELHKKRMTLVDDQLRADRTIEQLLSQKLNIPSFIKVPEPLPVWSR